MDAFARRMRASAVKYAQLGFQIFPLSPGSKMPWKGSHGELDASADPEHAERMWTELPRSNIAWAPGSSSAWVLDVDERSGGAEWLHTRLREQGALPDTVRVLTPSRGLGAHYWFTKGSGLLGVKCNLIGEEWRNGHGEKLAHDTVDVKGVQSGYVLMPPSRSAKGCYCFDGGVSFLEQEIAPTPLWLEETVREQGAPLTPRTEHTSRIEASSFYLGEWFEAHHLLGTQIRPGVWTALCPNREQHSGKPRKYAGDVLVFAPPPGRLGRGWAYCAHAHCRDLMTMLGCA